MSVALFRLELMGPFRLLGPDGKRIPVNSKKAQALIAMLAVSSGGERTRSWLQTQLWGSRGQDQAQASLRSELSAVRSTLNGSANQIIASDKNRVWLDLSRMSIDARDLGSPSGQSGDFLEGLDIPGEEGFEEWLRGERARLATGIRGGPALPIPVKASGADFASLPALAVLPFANLTGDPAHDYFAEGLSEDLIDRLSRLRWLPIISRGSSFAFKGGEQDPKAVGEALGARYVLEGRMRLQGGQHLLLVSLCDSETGQSLWSSKVPVEDASASVAVEAMLDGLVVALGAKIDFEEQTRALSKPQSDLNVRELLWRGRWHSNRMTKEDAALAKACFAEALALEPNSPEAIIQSVWARLWELWAERRTTSEIRALRQKAQKAIIADLDDARGHMLAGIAECWLKQPLRAERLLRHAISLNPSLVLAYAELGSVLYLNGKPDEAISVLNFAIKLSPNDYSLFYSLGELAICHLMIGDYVRAAEYADSSIMRRAAYWYSHVIKINALARNGESARAQAALDDLRTSKMQFKEEFIDWIPFVDSKWNSFLKLGLNQAGE